MVGGIATKDFRKGVHDGYRDTLEPPKPYPPGIENIAQYWRGVGAGYGWKTAGLPVAEMQVQLQKTMGERI